jgi:peptidoglycan/LPS O-acetylase OafA/YrhL
MQPSDRSPHIDSVRAVAALLVVWTHSAELFGGLVGGSWLMDVATRYNLGRMGVVAFFCISGFLIPASLNASRPDAGRAFVIRRFFRLFPAFWLSIPLGVLALWTLYDRPLPLMDIALNFTMVPDLFRVTHVIGLYWTLEYELAFYAMCLLLFKAGLLDRRYVTALATALFMGGYVLGFAALVLLQRQEYADLGTVSLNVGCLFLGALWRRAVDRRLDAFEMLILAGALALLWIVTPALCAAAIYLRDQGDNIFFVAFPTSYAVGVGLFLAMTSFAKVTWRPLAWIGLVSYSLYLLHPVVLYPMWFVFERGGPGAGWPVAVQMLIAAGLSLLLAAAAYYVVERPAIELARRLTGRRPVDEAAHAAP